MSLVQTICWTRNERDSRYPKDPKRPWLIRTSNMGEIAAEATQVAIITGGTSGIGFAVTAALAQRPNWCIYILGKNTDRGHQATEKLGYSNVIYQQCDVRKYQELANIFHSVYSKHGRVDHVFANAGMPSIETMMAKKEEQQPSGIPPEPNVGAVDVNLTSVVYTAYLALHYFRASPGAGKGTSLVINGSVIVLHPATINMALYSATKYGALGLTRCLAKDCWKEGIRVNILCLGPTHTNLLPEEVLADLFKPEHLCPMDLVVKNTLPLMDGSEIVASDGVRVSGDEIHGLAIEVVGSSVYVRPQLECKDDTVRAVLFLDS